MPRPPDPDRKPELLEQILEHLLDKPLGSITMRSLAEGLGVSTYTLVYHFGSKAGLIDEIVGAVAQRIRTAVDDIPMDRHTLDGYLQGYVDVWTWGVRPRNRQLRRLELEAGLLEAVGGAAGPSPAVRSSLEGWHREATRALVHFGVPEEGAEAEGRAVVAQFYGLLYDVIVTGEVKRVTASFRIALDAHRRRLERLLAASA